MDADADTLWALLMGRIQPPRPRREFESPSPLPVPEPLPPVPRDGSHMADEDMEVDELMQDLRSWQLAQSGLPDNLDMVLNSLRLASTERSSSGSLDGFEMLSSGERDNVTDNNSRDDNMAAMTTTTNTTRSHDLARLRAGVQPVEERTPRGRHMEHTMDDRLARIRRRHAVVVGTEEGSGEAVILNNHARGPVDATAAADGG